MLYRLLTAIIGLCFVTSTLFSQMRMVGLSSHAGSKVTILVADSATRAVLPGATVEVVHKSDTIRGSTAKTGSVFGYAYGFQCHEFFGKIPVQVKVTYMGYKPFFKSYPTTEFRNFIYIPLVEDAKSISQIVVEGKHVAMIMRGDTTIYNAAAFNTMEGDKLSELLRQLPGVTIVDDELQMNGEKIDRVYIDGQRFFGDDTKAPLENVTAKDVKNVKVYEQENEQAKRLGVTNSKMDKVMDVLTHSKPNRINNIKIMLSGGASIDKDYTNRHEPRHLERLIANTFTPKHMIKASASNSENSSSGGMKTMDLNKQTNADFGYTYHLADSLRISTDNSFNQRRTEQSSSLQRYYFPTDQYATRDYISQSDRLGKSYRISSRNGFMISRKRNFFNAGISVNHDVRQNDNLTQSLSRTDELTTAQTKISSYSRDENLDFSANASYAKAITSGRHVNIRSSIQRSLSNGDGWQIDTLASDGFKTHLDDYSRGYNNSYSANVSYTEPMNKKSSLSFRYNWDYVDSKSKRMSLDLLTNPAGSIDSINSYDYTVISNSNEISLDYMYRDETVFLLVIMKGGIKDMGRDESFPNIDRFPRTFYSVSPNINFTYSFSKVKRINLVYSSSMQDLSLEQLRGVIDTRNPLYLTAGNPDLKQSLRNHINLSYSVTNAETAQSLDIRFGAVYISNYLTSRTYYFTTQERLERYNYTAEAGSTLRTSVNVGGRYDLSANIGYSKRSEMLRSILRANVGYTFSQSPYYQRDQLFDMSQHRMNLRLSFESSFSSRFELNVNSTTSGAYTNTAATGVNRSLEEVVNAGIRATIKKKYVARTDVEYIMYRNPGVANSSRDDVSWNVELGRKFGQKNKLEVLLGVYDILNQASTRTTMVYEDYVLTSNRSVLGRSAYVSVFYTF